jgi:DNA-binding GntR family transcriptional regulator
MKKTLQIDRTDELLRKTRLAQLETELVISRARLINLETLTDLELATFSLPYYYSSLYPYTYRSHLYRYPYSTLYYPYTPLTCAIRPNCTSLHIWTIHLTWIIRTVTVIGMII